MKKVIIGGGSGLIGRRLTTLLLEKGYDVAWLSRSATPEAGITTYLWDPEFGKMDAHALENCDAIINLSGASISNHAWTKSYRKKVIEILAPDKLIMASQFSSACASIFPNSGSHK